MAFAIKTRDKRIAMVNQQSQLINQRMAEMSEYGRTVQDEMNLAVNGFNSGIKALQDLNSNDLNALLSLENPDNDIVATMDCVNALMQREVGWDSTKTRMVE